MSDFWKRTFLGILIAAFPFSAFAVTKALEKFDLAEAKRLRDDRRYQDAEAIYEKWLRAHPGDGYGESEYGYTLYLQASAEDRTTDAAALRMRAREHLLKAKKANYSDAIQEALLNGMDEHGNVRSAEFSADSEAQQLVQRGEQAFSRGDLDTALAAYQRAAEIDPNAYAAPLFVGDVYFNRGDFKTAITWFEKAAKIAPDVETPHRYWADALMKLRKRDEAEEKYIDAVIADPQSRFSREMIGKFADATGHPLNTPKVPLPRVRVTIKGKELQIGLSPTGVDAMIWAYTLARGQWLQEERQHYFTAESSVRHSLPEELVGLRTFVKVYDEMAATQKPTEVEKWADTARTLKKLDQDGLLEAYILLDRSDEGIAKDYTSYRLEHRDVLQRYIHHVWFGEKS